MRAAQNLCISLLIKLHSFHSFKIISIPQLKWDQKNSYAKMASSRKLIKFSKSFSQYFFQSKVFTLLSKFSKLFPHD